jgi:hypothetical protein
LVEPGIVPIQTWRPDIAPAGPLAAVNTYGGIGKRR